MGPLLSITFPQGFRISKNIGHSTSESGGKKTFKRYLKSEHTHGQTDGQTHRRTFRLIENVHVIPDFYLFHGINSSYNFHDFPPPHDFPNFQDFLQPPNIELNWTN